MQPVILLDYFVILLAAPVKEYGICYAASEHAFNLKLMYKDSNDFDPVSSSGVVIPYKMCLKK